jgi:hypothetical protein
MSAQWHPDTEVLARHQASLIGGFRGRRLAAHVAGCARCASVSDQLAAVGPVLASVPAAPMPDAVERQITAALAAEAATRQAAAGQAAAVSGGPRRPRARGFRLAMAAIPAAACLLLAGLGYLLSQTGSSTSSSAASAAAPASRPSGVSAPAAAGRAVEPTKGAKPMFSQPGAPFLVIASGISYQKATLGAQVRGELDSNAGSSSATFSPQSSGNQAAASGSAGSAPSRTLAGCVLYLTGNAPPRLVDKATYEGMPAYVIATADKAWVVGRGCTASHPDLITSVTLPR